MQTDLRFILQALRDGTPVRGTEGGLQVRRTVQLVEEFDTLIAVSEIDVGTQLAIPIPLASVVPIDQGDYVLLIPENNLKFYHANIPDPFEEIIGGVEIGAGGLWLIVGGNLALTPPLPGVLLVENTRAEPVRLRGAVGGTTQG